MSHGLFRNRKADATRTAEALLVGAIMAIAVISAALLLSGCAHDQVEPIVLKAPAPPPILCQPIPDEPKPQGGVVRPITPEEIQAFDRFLDYELNLILYGREGWGRARVARETYCP